MAYSSRLREKPKSLSQMTKAEKEERARQMNLQASATAGTRKVKYNTKASGGINLGRSAKSSASTAKGMLKLSSNPNRREKQIAAKRERGNSVCSPTSKSRRCGPNAK